MDNISRDIEQDQKDVESTKLRIDISTKLLKKLEKQKALGISEITQSEMDEIRENAEQEVLYEKRESELGNNSQAQGVRSK